MQRHLPYSCAGVSLQSARGLRAFGPSGDNERPSSPNTGNDRGCGCVSASEHKQEGLQKPERADLDGPKAAMCSFSAQTQLPSAALVCAVRVREPEKWPRYCRATSHSHDNRQSAANETARLEIDRRRPLKKRRRVRRAHDVRRENVCSGRQNGVRAVCLW